MTNNIDGSVQESMTSYVPATDVKFGESFLTAEDLLAPDVEGNAPAARRLLDQATLAYPVDEEGKVYFGPAALSKTMARGLGRASHPYVAIELIQSADQVVAIKRGGKDYYVGEDELYRVTVSNDPEILEEVRAGTQVKETHYSAQSGEVNVLVPRTPRPKQTHFPGGM